jgi:hypothetical protein
MPTTLLLASTKQQQILFSFNIFFSSFAERRGLHGTLTANHDNYEN